MLPSVRKQATEVHGSRSWWTDVDSARAGHYAATCRAGSLLITMTLLRLRSQPLLTALAVPLALLVSLGMARTGHAAVDPLGSFTHRIEIEVSAFRGLTPVVGLNYASNAGNGFVGVGWSLGAGETITRVSATQGAPRGDATDRYMLAGNELIPCAAGSRSLSCTTAITAFGSSAGFYSTQIESFERIRRDVAPVDGWTIWGRDGTRRTLRSQDLGASYQLTAVTDTHGNTVSYAYWCDASDACYPDAITYAGVGAAPGASIRFYREPRPDPFEVSRANSLTGYITTFYRLASIVVHMDGKLARAYRLRYSHSLSNGASVLSSVEQFGRDANVADPANILAGATPPLPRITLTTPSMHTGRAVVNPWITNAGLTGVVATATAYSPRFAGLLPVPYNPATYFSGEDEEVHYRPYGDTVGDFDGDGRADWLTWSMQNYGCGTIELKVVLTTKTGHKAPIVTSNVSGPLTGAYAAVPAVSCEIDVYVADLDGNGRDDLLMVRGRNLIKLISRGDGTFWNGTNPHGWVKQGARCGIGDFDGDGRADIACTSGTPGGVLLHVARSLGGDVWNYTNDTLAGLGVSSMANHLVTTGDFNADGLTDIIIATKTGSTWTLLAGASNGTGFTWKTQPTTWGHGANTEHDTLTRGDFDGDGKSDIMLIRALSGPDEAHIGLAAKGATERFRLVQVASPAGLNEISTGDFNADGKTDLVLGGRWARGRGDGQFDTPATAAFGCSNNTFTDLKHLFVADLNGDGRDDLLCVDDDDEKMAFQLGDLITVAPAEDSHGWMQADINGDGVAELVRVSHLAPGYRITVVSPVTQLRTTFDITTAATGGVGLDEAATDRWIPMDVGSPSGGPDGKADLVLVDKDSGNSGAGWNALQVYSLLSVGNGTFTLRIDTPWRDANNNVMAYGGRDLQNWRPADLDGDGNGDLVHLVAHYTGVTVEYLRARGDGARAMADSAEAW